MRTLIIMLLLYAAPAHLAWSHGDEDHGGPAPAPVPMSENSATESASSETFELVIKHPHLSPGKEETLKLFLSDFGTNQPVEKAQIEFTAKGAGEAKATVTESEVHGIYEGKISFPVKGEYQATIRVRSGELEDTLIIDGISVGAKGSSTGNRAFLYRAMKWLLILTAMLAILAAAIRKRSHLAGWIQRAVARRTGPHV